VTDSVAARWWRDAVARPGVLAAALADDVTVDDPRTGTARGRDAACRHLDELRVWLTDVAVEPVAELTDGRRTVAEAVLIFPTFRLPCAVVTEQDGDAVTAVRVHHTLAPAQGRNRVRSPSLPADPTARAGGVVGRYQEALAAADVDGLVGLYAPDGSFQEPAGPPFVHAGADALRAFFTGLLGFGAVRVATNAVVDDGRRCAVEYTYLGAGPVDLPPQAALQTYVRTSTGDRLAATGNYDSLVLPGS
jgi:hypothetical protein